METSCESEVDILNLQRRRQTQDHGTLEKLPG
jgi:hypothetical protein